jgi:DNA mismatch endonuclease (patch repair protein)
MTPSPNKQGLRSRRLATTPERSALFSRVRQRGTAPEIMVQEILMRLGHSFTTNVRGIPGSPDIVASDQSRAVLVHGCYWHRHPQCSASSTPTRNAEFWKEKFAANVRRDRRKARELRKLGYRVMTVWECQTKSSEKRARLERRLNRFFGRPK